MKAGIAVLAVVLAFAGVAAYQPAHAAAQTTNPDLHNIPVTADVTGALQGTLQGTLNIDHFAVQNGQVVAVGMLDNVPVSVPVTVDPSSSCEILHLVLGPLDLNLLGLMIHLNQVVLDISAQPGPGNLLGNLLCNITHLLDNNNQQPLSAQLNNVLRALSG